MYECMVVWCVFFVGDSFLQIKYPDKPHVGKLTQVE